MILKELINWFIVKLFLVLVLVFLLGLLFNILYHQIGSTCGFYALTYGTAKIKLTRNKKRMVKKIIIDSIENKYSYVGEIFDVNTLHQIAKRNFPNAEFELADIKNIDDLDEYLIRNYIIFPCIIKDIPQYYFLEKSLGKKYVYRGSIFAGIKIKKKKDLYKLHEGLKEKKEFHWNKYFENKDKKKVSNVVLQIIWAISDYKLNRYLNQAEKRVRKEMFNKRTPIDMYGKVLLIKKTSLSD